MAGVRLLCVLAGLLLELAADEQPEHHGHQDDHHDPADVLGEVNCQPISTHSTSPSSHTRFVEANWNASAEAAEAPFWKSDFPIAIAA